MGKILFADDDSAMREMVADVLRVDGHSVRVVPSGDAALAELRRDPPDLTILDYRMGRPNGFEVCRQIKDNPQYEHLPVLILTGRSGVEDRISGFAAGANDYLQKPFDARELVARVRALLRLTEQSRSLNPTTGLPGGNMIEREFERRRQSGRPFTLCYLDLDNFKPFNDRFGFAIADAVIGGLGTFLRETVFGTGAFAGHIGGDDFLILCDATIAWRLVESAQQAVKRILAEVLPPEVAAHGSYFGRTRSGSEAVVPVTRLSGVLLHLDAETAYDLAWLGEVAADVKGRAKASTANGVVELKIHG